MDIQLTETREVESPPPDSVDLKVTLDGPSQDSPPTQTLDGLVNSSAIPPESNNDESPVSDYRSPCREKSLDDLPDSFMFDDLDSPDDEEHGELHSWAERDVPANLSLHWSSTPWDSRERTKTPASGWRDWPSAGDPKPSASGWPVDGLQDETDIKPSLSVSLASSSEVNPAMVGAGLANLGNTCFLNAILQCFTHTVPLVQGLRSYNHPRPCNRDSEGFCVLCALCHLVELSITSMGRVVQPWKFVDNLSQISSDFRRNQQEDAHEFLQCLLDRLERCIESNTKDMSLAAVDENLVKRVFGGRLVSKLQCCNCGHFSDTYEPLIDLSLEIENVGSIPSALESFTKVEKIEDPETKFTCEQCKEEVSVEKQLLLDQAPSVAAFHLKRFKNDGSHVEKIDKHVEFPLELDLLPYTGGSGDNNVELKYDLYAIVVHIGSSSTSGHYYCFIRSAPDAWYRLDDSKVTRVGEDFVLSQEAYILFYAKQGTPWFSSFVETEKSSLDQNLFNNSPKSVLDNVDHISKPFPTGSNFEVDEAIEHAVGVSAGPSDECRNNGVEVTEAGDDSHKLFTITPRVMGNSSGGMSFEVEKKISPSFLKDNIRKQVQEVELRASNTRSSPPRSPSPDIYAKELPVMTFAIPTDHWKTKKQVSCKRQLEKDLEDDSRTKEARRILRKMPNERAEKLLAAMKGPGPQTRSSSRVESSSTRNTRSSSARHKPDLTSSMRPVAAGGLR